MCDEQLYALVAKENVLCTEQLRGWAASPFVQARYLKAYVTREKAAEEMVVTAVWRHEYDVDNIRWADVHHEAASGKMYMSLDLRDRWGRPVVVMRPRNQNHANPYDDQVRYFIYVMERAMYAADSEGVGTICWVGDYAGWTLRHNPPFKMSMELLAIVQRHYPCLIGLNLILNHPVYFQVLYGSLQPFITSLTMQKIKFISKTELKDKMAEFFESDELEIALGGSSPQTYVHALWGGDMKDLESRQRKDYAAYARGRPEPTAPPTRSFTSKHGSRSKATPQKTKQDSGATMRSNSALPEIKLEPTTQTSVATLNSALPPTAMPHAVRVSRPGDPDGPGSTAVVTTAQDIKLNTPASAATVPPRRFSLPSLRRYLGHEVPSTGTALSSGGQTQNGTSSASHDLTPVSNGKTSNGNTPSRWSKPGPRSISEGPARSENGLGAKDGDPGLAPVARRGRLSSIFSHMFRFGTTKKQIAPLDEL